MDAHTMSMFRWLEMDGLPCVSDLARLEVASAIGNRVRRRELSSASAIDALTTLDVWLRDARRSEWASTDLADAEHILRRFELSLRTADALHVVACRRLDLPLLTFDRRQGEAARALGVEWLNLPGTSA